MGVAFSICTDGFSWLNGEPDDPTDLCSHGNVAVQVGGERLEYDCCTSAAALRMLKTLSETHIGGGDTGQMLPCCGHFMILDEKRENVEINGCQNGVDYTVEPQGDTVRITTQAGNTYCVSREDYLREVSAFADQVEVFYRSCTPKRIEDSFDRDGYTAFWNEWHRRLSQAKAELKV